MDCDANALAITITVTDLLINIPPHIRNKYFSVAQFSFFFSIVKLILSALNSSFLESNKFFFTWGLSGGQVAWSGVSVVGVWLSLTFWGSIVIFE